MASPIAIVTGASHGIGLAAARALLEAGYRVFGLCRRPGPLDKVSWIPCDVLDPDAVARAFSAVAEAGPPDLLVLSAGMGVSGAAEFTSEQALFRQLGVNLSGAVRCATQALPAMRRRGQGRIVFISSLAALFPLPFQSLYSASKAGLTAFSDALGLEAGPYGVQCCTLLLGDIKTDFTASREKCWQGDGDYGGRIRASVEKMERSEQSGASPEQVAAALLRLLRRRKLPPHYILGAGNRLLALAARLLPTRWMLALLGKIYG